MKVSLSTNTSLVVNPLNGVSMIVNNDWWNSLSLDWLSSPVALEHIPICGCDYKTLKGETGKHPTGTFLGTPNSCTLHEWDFLKKNDFFLTQKLYQEKLDGISNFAEVFRKKRQTTFFITPDTQNKGCPLACVYCFQKEAEHSEKALLKEGSISQIKEFIRWYQLENNLPAESICIQLFGGEPFQSKFRPFWYEILELVKNNGWCWAAVTSGATITREDVVMIQQYKDFNLQELNITCDGLEDEHNALRPYKGGRGTWKTVVGNISMLLDADIPVLVKTNFGVKNIKSYPLFLDMIKNNTNWRAGDLVLMTNIIQSFGDVETQGVKGTEDALILALCDIFSHPDYQCFLPIIRLEGKKLTGYLAHVLGPKVVKDADRERNGKAVFDNYPYQGFCNPAKGTSWNMDPEGYMRACNWMDGQKDFIEMSIFDKSTWQNKSRYFNPVSKNPTCSRCDISTLCGGGCAIDIQKKGSDGEYFLSCREKHYRIINDFVTGCVERGWVDVRLTEGTNFRVLSEGFDFDYTYYNRAFKRTRISQKGAALI
jgi:radical SAM protein with 4Fe4S-binding SPASM domain